MQDFHNLRVWQKANRFTLAIRRLLATFPRRGYGTLKRQMIKSSESIADNIAEGCGTSSNADFARFLDMSIRSASELENQLERTRTYGLVNEARWRRFADEDCTIRKMTYGLRRKVVAADANLPPDLDAFAKDGEETPESRGRSEDDDEGGQPP